MLSRRWPSRRPATAYDTGGRPYLFTSYNAASGGTLVNQVQDAYNGLGQLITEYQSSSGAVNTTTTPKVQYAYSQMAGGANHSRQVSMTYPNGRVVNDNYASGLDDSISRLSSISDSSATLESYVYLGLATVVKRGHPQPGVDLTYIKQTGEATGDAGDQYTGLDRFGRVVDQRWLVSATGVATDRFQYGYDRNGNRLYRDNKVNSAFAELYHASGASNGYDSLNQLSAFARGTLSDTNADGVPDTVASATRSQSWALDALGNWTSVTTNGTAQTRTANQQNQITSISGLTTPTYDKDGNTTTDQAGKTLIYDAWNRLVAYKSGISSLAAYGYDALGRRITETASGTTKTIFFSSSWQVLEERIGTTVKTQYVWSPVYMDALVLRDRDADGNSANGLEERFYAQQDANWNVTALVTTTGTESERYTYDPYGQVSYLDGSWGSRAASSYTWVYLHQGGRLDTTTGLYNFRNRGYSPVLARWVQVDPLGLDAGDSNIYRYVDGSPVNYVDPEGLQSAGPSFGPAPPMLRPMPQSGAAASPSSMPPMLDPVLQFPGHMEQPGWGGPHPYRPSYNPEDNYGMLIWQARNLGVSEQEIQAALRRQHLSRGGNPTDFTGQELRDLIRKQAFKQFAQSFDQQRQAYKKIECTSKDPCKNEPVHGPYSFLAAGDPTPIVRGAPFDPWQKALVQMANFAQHGGKLISDDPRDPYRELAIPQQSMGGVSSDMSQAEVDHIVPRSRNGTNSLCNARLISKRLNVDKRSE